VAMLFQNDSGGKILGEIYEPIFKARGIETMTEYFEPGTKDFSPVLAKIAGFKPDYLFPGYSDAALYDIVRQSIEGNYSKKFFLVRGSTGPGLKNKDGLEYYMVYVPKDFEEAEKKEPKVKHFIEAYKAFHKRDFPYDQAPLCSSSCYDHVYMLVEAMKKAGTVDDVAKVNCAAVANTTTETKAVNVGTGVGTSVNTVAAELGRLLGYDGQIRISGRYRAGDIRHNIADVALLKAEFGQRCDIDFATGLEEFVAWAGPELQRGTDNDGYVRSLSELAERGLMKGG